MQLNLSPKEAEILREAAAQQLNHYRECLLQHIEAGNPSFVGYAIYIDILAQLTERLTSTR